MAEIFNKREYLKNLIRRADKNPEELERLKEEIKSVIKDLKPVEIALVENELSREDGITVERIREICDVHLELMEELMKESVNFAFTDFAFKDAGATMTPDEYQFYDELLDVYSNSLFYIKEHLGEEKFKKFISLMYSTYKKTYQFLNQ